MNAITQTHTAKIRYGISKAQDTWGYNTCSLQAFGKKFIAKGGNYDLLSTVLAEYLDFLLTDEQKEKALKAGLYGIRWYNDMYIIDGCGVSTLQKIAKISGWKISETYSYDRKGRIKDTIGFIFEPI